MYTIIPPSALLSPKEIKKGLDYLIGNKKIETKNYFDWIDSLKDERQEFRDENGYTMYAKIMTATCGFNALFVDKNGYPIEPQPSFQWTVVGEAAKPAK